MRLIEVPALGCERRGRPSGRLLHLMQRLLKANDCRETLGAVAHPDPHQPVEVTRTHLTARGDLRHRQAALLPLDLTNRIGDDSMNLTLVKPLDQKVLQRVDAVHRLLRPRLRNIGQQDRAAHHRVRLDAADQERDAGTKPNADDRRSRLIPSYCRPVDRTAQEPSRRRTRLNLNGNGRTAVRHDADRCVPFRGDYPEASDEPLERAVGLVEPNLRAIDQSARDAHTAMIAHSRAPAKAGGRCTLQRFTIMRSIPWRRCLPALLTLACVFSVVGVVQPATEQTLEVYVENAADPFSRPDGTGYANDVVRAAFEAVGVRVRFVVVPYARCKYKVLSGEAVACVSMSWDPSFEGQVKFADTPLISVTPVYYENPARPLSARSEAELGKGVTLGTIRGYEYPDSVMKAKARGVLFEENASEQANLQKLALGRIDAALVMSNPLTGVDHWVDDANVAQHVRIAFTSATSENGYFAVSTRHPGGLPALRLYNKGITIITANGRLGKIKSKWTKR